MAHRSLSPLSARAQPLLLLRFRLDGRAGDLLLALLVVAWLAATAGARPLMLPDEGRYVGVAWEMLRSGDWLTPTLDGLPYFHKPPLFYWITAGSLTLFGAHEWAARAAPLLGASLGALATFFFVRRWSGPRSATLTLIALLAQPLFFGGAQFANLDMLVAGLISATVVLAAHAALCVEHGLPWRRALGAAWVTAALAVLAKGLIGIVIPALVVGGWLLARRRWRVLATLLWWPGIGLFLLVAAPWFIAMQRLHAGFFDYFFVVQHFRRFAAGGFNNEFPFWFYPALLLAASLPWLPSLARSPIRRGGYFGDARRGPLRLLMVLWLLAVLLFFSIPRSKLIGYILPAMPPLAFLLAEGFALDAAPSTRARRLWIAGNALAAALGLAAVLWLAFFPTRSSRPIALALAAQRGAQEPIVMLHEYVFDLPFYARLRAPVAVVDDWRRSEVERHDNWRKELADAGLFDEARAQELLIGPPAVAPLLCRSGVGWLIGHPRLVAHYPFLAAAQVVQSTNAQVLWRVDARAPALSQALGCTGKAAGASAR